MLLLTAGCGMLPNARIGETEKLERANALYREAMAEFEAGRTDAALERFGQLLRTDPGNFSAHFQMAVILQDAKKDYIGAMIHYREYRELRPDADKSAIAQEREAMCEALHIKALARKAAEEDTSVRERISKLESERDKVQAALTGTVEELSAAKKRIAALEQTNALQKRMIDAFAEKGDADANPSRLKEALAQIEPEDESEKRGRLINPSDADLLDDDSPAPHAGSSDEAKRLKREMADEEKEPAHVAEKPKEKPQVKSSPESIRRPEEYVVQEGDTLMSISLKFYQTRQDWRKIREANKAVIPPDGSVKAGQKIRLP